MHNERCTSGSARGHAKPPLVNSDSARMPYSTEAEGSTEVDLLLPVRDSGHLQPPGCGLDGGRLRIGKSGQTPVAPASQLIRESCDKQRIDRDQLILHADRGSSMKSKGGVATFKKRQQSD